MLIIARSIIFYCLVVFSIGVNGPLLAQINLRHNIRITPLAEVGSGVAFMSRGMDEATNSHPVGFFSQVAVSALPRTHSLVPMVCGISISYKSSIIPSAQYMLWGVGARYYMRPTASAKRIAHNTTAIDLLLLTGNWVRDTMPVLFYTPFPAPASGQIYTMLTTHWCAFATAHTYGMLGLRTTFSLRTIGVQKPMFLGSVGYIFPTIKTNRYRSPKRCKP